MHVSLVKISRSITEHSIAEKFECLDVCIYQINVFSVNCAGTLFFCILYLLPQTKKRMYLTSPVVPNGVGMSKRSPADPSFVL
jgi:hypothetical protein